MVCGGGLVLAGQAIRDRPGAIEARVAELTAQDAQRDVERTEELIVSARAVYDELVLLLEEVNVALPAGGVNGVPVTIAAVTAWRGTVAEERVSLEDRRSAGTSVNVTRAGLDAALVQLDRALGTYELSLAAPVDHAAALSTLAAELRSDAVVVWSLAATQLDDLAVETDLGHVHLYLSADPASGAMSPDGAPEGEAP